MKQSCTSCIRLFYYAKILSSDRFAKPFMIEKLSRIQLHEIPICKQLNTIYLF